MLLRRAPAALLGLLSLCAWGGEDAAAASPPAAPAASASAATGAEARARAEVELQLQRMTRAPPPSLEIRFDGIESGPYELVEAELALDGQRLPAQPALGKGGGGGPGAVLFFGMVQPGEHVVTATLVYREPRQDDLFGSSGLRFKLPGRFIITAQNGLVMRMRTWVQVNAAAADPRDRLALVATVEPMVVSALEETDEPSGRWRARAKVTRGEKVTPVPIRNTAR